MHWQALGNPAAGKPLTTHPDGSSEDGRRGRHEVVEDVRMLSGSPGGIQPVVKSYLEWALRGDQLCWVGLGEAGVCAKGDVQPLFLEQSRQGSRCERHLGEVDSRGLGKEPP